KQNRTMAIVELEDLTGSIEMVVFPDLYDEVYELLEADQAVRVGARVDKRNDTLQLVAQTVASVSLEPVTPPEPIRFNEVLVQLPVSEDVANDVDLMRRI